jgi:hypothetical protein
MNNYRQRQVPLPVTDDPVHLQARNFREAVQNTEWMAVYMQRAQQDRLAEVYREWMKYIDGVQEEELKTVQRLHLYRLLNDADFNWNYAKSPVAIDNEHFDFEVPLVPLPADFPSRDDPGYQAALRRWWAARDVLSAIPLDSVSLLERELYRRQTRETLRANGLEFSSIRDMHGFELVTTLNADVVHQWHQSCQEWPEYRQSRPVNLPQRIQEENTWTPEFREKKTARLREAHQSQTSRLPGELLPNMWDSDASFTDLCTKMENGNIS